MGKNRKNERNLQEQMLPIKQNNGKKFPTVKRV